MQWRLGWTLWLLGMAACGGVQAQTLLDTCHATSSYDVTVRADGVLFDRAEPAPRRVYLHDGKLQIDGTPAKLDAEASDRITLIERIVRSLEPGVKRLADRGVDLAAQAVREQATTSADGASAELDARLADVVRDLKARIARSDSSHDWHGPAFQQYADQNAARIVPLLAAGMVQQAVVAAMNGDFDEAAQLRERATQLATDLRTRIERKLQVLRPGVQALCPSLQRLDDLESGIHTPLPGGAHLNLVDITASP